VAVRNWSASRGAVVALHHDGTVQAHRQHARSGMAREARHGQRPQFANVAYASMKARHRRLGGRLE
jgi:hypothetical protein